MGEARVIGYNGGMASIQALVRDYLNYLEIDKNRSVKTRENYERYLKAFLAFSRAKHEKDITVSAVKEFRLHLARTKTARGGDYAKATQAYYVIAIRNFLKYLLKQGHDVLSPDMIELPRVLRRQIDIVEYRDLERLLAAPSGNGVRVLRDRAILETLFSTGLRISELCALNRYLDLERGELSVRGKGGKIRVVFFSERAKKVLRDYLVKRTDPDEALFVSFTKAKLPKIIGRILPRTIQRLVQFYSRKAGIPDRVTPHQLRHQFATDLLMGGADLRSVQELLGHASIATTQVYTHITNKGLREVHRAFHGRRRK